MNKSMVKRIKSIKINWCTVMHVAYHSLFLGGGGVYLAQVNEALDRAEEIAYMAQQEVRQTVADAKKLSASVVDGVGKQVDRVEAVGKDARNIVTRVEGVANKVQNTANQLNDSVQKADQLSAQLQSALQQNQDLINKLQKIEKVCKAKGIF